MSEINHPGSTLPVFTNHRNESLVSKFGGGDVIYDVATPAQFVYYIVQGGVHMYVPGPQGAVHLQIIMSPGAWFGVGAVAGDANYGMRAVAAAGTVLRQIPIEQFREELAQDPKQALEVARQLAVMLRTSVLETARMVFEDSTLRLIRTLVRFAESPAATQHPDGVAVHLTHEQLAQAVGVARETVSLAIAQLRQLNLIRTGRSQLIFSPQVLNEYAESYVRTQDPGPKTPDC